ncbi:choice-of-anchor J domain-containing protein [Pontiella agarivorans]|uniref:Choice-of-anchor J domain-containing protein n=1 Tax=Pontiella agarivorans TaxID=3038953 RepID=A0ABU5MVH5_9BACT|nr:choice-of-anchor J domain-containing protein [Pontiella agarivorans]MDZ8118170.1 choice-of-anchor J domain-containing protein [Pontiella agarivorans]
MKIPDYTTTGALLLALGLAGPGLVNAATERYRLVWTDDPATTATIGWEQSSGPPVGVRYSTDAGLAGAATNTSVVSHYYDNTLTTEGSPFTSHFIDLTGLSADTAYYFEILDSEGASTLMWFKTAPDTPSDFTFVAGGDSRTNDDPRRWGMNLISRIRPLFIVYGGDYMNNGTNDEWRQWLDEWQATISSDGRIYPIIPQHGNHENDMLDMMQRIFNIRNPNAYGHFPIGGNQMRVWALNSELEPGVGYGAFQNQDSSAWGAQTAWLSNELAKVSNYATWQVASYHRPMRPHTSGKAEGTGRIAAWADAFYNYGMDLAVESDTHMTKYTYPLEPSTAPGSFQDFTRNLIDGTMFIGEGSWGAPTRPMDDDKTWTLASDSFWQFKLIHVHTAPEPRMDIRTVRFGSIDEFNAGNLYDPETVTPLTQAEQDLDPYAMSAGLDLWKPLSGEVLTIYPNDSVGGIFRGADVEQNEYVATGAEWKYLDDGSDQGTSWTSPAFDDSTWMAGDAQLGYGDGDEVTVISYGPNASDKHITAYFRKEFSVADPADVIKLNAQLLRDDGAVVYINGTEAARSSMPDGDISYTTTANDAGDENEYYELTLDPSLLVAGTNVVAVEVHQSSGGSSDTSFDLSLIGTESRVIGPAPETPTNLVGTALSVADIELTWADVATNEVGYELWRKVGDSNWEIYAPRLVPDTDGYADSLLNENTVYTYKVRAYSPFGLSDFSDTVAVTTLVANVPVVWSEDFDTGSFGPLLTHSDTSNTDWHTYEYPSGSGLWFARINGYGADTASRDWLITPAFNLSVYMEETIAADLAYNYDGPLLEVLASGNYDPETMSSPSEADWWTLPSMMPSTGGYAFETTGELDFSLTPLEDFEDGIGSFTQYSRSSNADWVHEQRAGQWGMVANGFGADDLSDDWLISPAFALPEGAAGALKFQMYHKYGRPDLEVMVSTNYTGTGDPLANGTWDSFTVPPDSDLFWDTWEDISVDLSAYAGTSVNVAFRYTTTGTGSGGGARIGVDNVKVESESENVRVAFLYTSTGTGGGQSRVWEVDNIVLRANAHTYMSEDFDDADTLGDSSFTANSLLSNADWGLDTEAEQKGAFANGYGADTNSIDWLVGPTVKLEAGANAELQFDVFSKYGGPSLEVMVTTDYPVDVTNGTWQATEIDTGDLYDAWTSASVDLSSYLGPVTVAFRYTTTGTGPGDGRLLGVDNIRIVRTGGMGLSVNFTIDQSDYTTIEPVTFVPFVTSGTEPYSYLWNFGDGETSTEASPIHLYENAGLYTVSLTVTDAETNQMVQTQADLVQVYQVTYGSVLPGKQGNLRIATYNAYLNRSAEGDITAELASRDSEQVQKVAEIIQRTNPDIILLNEFDYDATTQAVERLKSNYLEISQNGAPPIVFPYMFLAESNTGIDSGYDLNNDGSFGTADDCFGFGEFPGQYGMVVLSKYPIDTENVRTFQKFLWKDMPGALLPNDGTTDYYSAAELDVVRLSSKSHWDVPVNVDGEMVHVLASHPTPPVFDDGDADIDANVFDWNGKRNHDEIRFWADYVTPGAGSYIYDDNGVTNQLAAGSRFVIMGDQNADADEGDSYNAAINQLLTNVNINAAFVPESEGSLESTGDTDDTASWGLRADYVLPGISYGIKLFSGGVYWPSRTDIHYYLTKADGSSDHRLVWLDLEIFPDADNDGLDDAFEQQIVDADGGDAINDIYDVLGSDDFDGDGISNADEFYAGTSPIDGSSWLVITGFNDGVLEWVTSSGKTYTVEFATNLTAGAFEPVASNIVDGVYTDTVHEAYNQMFYRIKAE